MQRVISVVLSTSITGNFVAKSYEDPELKAALLDGFKVLQVYTQSPMAGTGYVFITFVLDKDSPSNPIPSKS